jgi:hypothetical protein
MSCRRHAFSMTRQPIARRDAARQRKRAGSGLRKFLSPPPSLPQKK